MSTISQKAVIKKNRTFENPLCWQLNIDYVIPENATLYSKMHASVYNGHSTTQHVTMCTNVRDSVVVVLFYDSTVTVDEFH